MLKPLTSKKHSNFNRKQEMVGTHIRLNDTLNSVINKALELSLPIFQTFLVTSNGKRMRISPKEIQEFREQSAQFSSIYVHASYWVNLSSKASHGIRAIDRELALASELGLSKLIIHPGAATGCNDKIEGINHLTSRLNAVIKEYPEFTILLENTTHAKNCIGSDIQDFQQIFEQLEQPDKFQLCIDTAHAYGYGYDIASSEGQASFLEEIDTVVGVSKIGLIHLNDTPETLGNKIDRHAIPGQGNIGVEALKEFVNHKKLKHIPIILELPVLPEDEEAAVITQVNNWRKK